MEDGYFVDIVIKLIKLQDFCTKTHYCENCPFKIDRKCAFVDDDHKGLQPFQWDIREILYRYVGGKEE